MENPEDYSVVYFGIEQHFNGAATTLKQIDTMSDLSFINESGSIATESLLKPLGELLGTQLSTEDLKGRIAELFKRFLDGLVTAWDYMVTYFDTAYSQANMVLSKADKLIDSAKARTSSTPKSVDVDIGDVSHNVLMGNKPVEPTELIRKLSELTEVLNTILIDHVSEVMNASKYISPLVESLMTTDITNPTALQDIQNDAKAIAKFGNEVHDSLMSYRGTDATGTRSELLSGHGITNIKNMGNLLGGKSLFVKYGNVDKAAMRGVGIPFFNVIGTIFSSGIVLAETDPNKSDSKGVLLRTLSPSEVESLARAIEDAVEPIKRFKRRYDVELKAQRKRYQQLRGKLSVLAKDGDNAEINLYLRRIGSAAMGLSRWYYDPFIPLINHVLRVTKTSILYAEKSLAQWPMR